MPNPTALTMQEDEMDYPAADTAPEDYIEFIDRVRKQVEEERNARSNSAIKQWKTSTPDKLVVPTANSGLRYDDGKPRFDLIPPEAMIALAAHYERGARKYADRNWEKGMVWGKCFASLQRHAWAWANGEDIDAETDTHHMIAVAWNAIALYTYAMRKIGTDDRAKTNAN